MTRLSGLVAASTYRHTRARPGCSHAAPPRDRVPTRVARSDPTFEGAGTPRGSPSTRRAISRGTSPASRRTRPRAPSSPRRAPKRARTPRGPEHSNRRRFGSRRLATRVRATPRRCIRRGVSADGNRARARLTQRRRDLGVAWRRRRRGERRRRWRPRAHEPLGDDDGGGGASASLRWCGARLASARSSSYAHRVRSTTTRVHLRGGGVGLGGGGGRVVLLVFVAVVVRGSRASPVSLLSTATRGRS